MTKGVTKVKRLKSLKVKKLTFIICVTFVTFIACVTFKTFFVYADDWKEEKGDHFIVYYQGDQKFPKDVSRQSEVYYNQIANDIGYPRYSNFWQWDNRVKIYVYPSKTEFQKASNQPEWSNGMADYTAKRILTYSWSKGFLDGLLPHEITHLVFRDFVGFKGQVPLWIDEGVAQWEEPKKRAMAGAAAYYLIQQQKVIPVGDLTVMNNLRNKSDEEVQSFYMQSVSLIDYLIKNYGAQSFTALCRQLRDGKKLNEALSFSYSTVIKDIDQLQDKWMRSVMEEFRPKAE
ncbi:MAG: hypothetical protein AUJ72_05090 [Candidatus Omnitrophica bacterium CG1_02_46_14]|nr:MAG: hypothetical protein AUJ72_05090 [Candidatus Omnitrophica bacterium CG1_02_46_14]